MATSTHHEPANAPESSETVATAQALRDLRSYRIMVARVVETFGDEIKASRWLSRPNPEFNGETLLQAVQKNEYNAEILVPILTRIEHGIYS